MDGLSLRPGVTVPNTVSIITALFSEALWVRWLHPWKQIWICGLPSSSDRYASIKPLLNCEWLVAASALNHQPSDAPEPISAHWVQQCGHCTPPCWRSSAALLIADDHVQREKEAQNGKTRLKLLLSQAVRTHQMRSCYTQLLKMQLSLPISILHAPWQSLSSSFSNTSPSSNLKLGIFQAVEKAHHPQTKLMNLIQHHQPKMSTDLDPVITIASICESTNELKSQMQICKSCSYDTL